MNLTGMPVLAFGTSGDQGSGLLDALTDHGAVAVVASSRADAVTGHQQAGRRAVRADLTQPSQVAEAAREAGAAAAVLHVPLSLSAQGQAGSVVESVGTLTGAGLAVSMNLGTVLPPAGAPDPFGVRDLAQALAATGATVLAVTAYLENHSTPWALPELARGELAYPRPADDPVAWLTARDVTAAAVSALARDLSGRTFQLAGPQVLTFVQLAEELGAGLNRPLTFRQISPDQFGQLLSPFLGEAAAQGVAAGYRAMPPRPNPLMAQDTGDAWRELGVTPRSARTWAATVLAPRVAGAAPSALSELV